MLRKKLEFYFLGLIVIASGVLCLNFYQSYSFKHNEIPDSYKQRLYDKENQILRLMEKNYGFSHIYVHYVTLQKINNII
jgi:hypothetical protein